MKLGSKLAAEAAAWQHEKATTEEPEAIRNRSTFQIVPDGDGTFTLTERRLGDRAPRTRRGLSRGEVHRHALKLQQEGLIGLVKDKPE